MLDVAIVDDEEDVRAELGQMVRRFCAQEAERVCVHEYVDGSELLDAAATSCHDVILLDIEMARWTAWTPPTSCAAAASVRRSSS